MSLILPGKNYGPTREFSRTGGTGGGYDQAAKALLDLRFNEGRHVDERDPNVQSILNYHGCTNVEQLKNKLW